MQLTVIEQQVINILRTKGVCFGKLTLVVHYQNGKIVTVGIEKEYETVAVTDGAKGSKI